jgi:two-component system, response regulator YesN
MYQVLVVDDEPTILEGISQLLEAAFPDDVGIYRAVSGSEAMNAMYRSRMDVVVSDIRMPGLDGLELIRAVESRWPRCRVIMLTGYDSFEYIQEASRSTVFDAYVLKSEADDAIVSAVHRALDHRRKDAEREKVRLDAENRLRELLPVIKQELLANMVQGHLPEEANLWRNVSEVDLGIDPDGPLLLVLGHVQPGSDPDRSSVFDSRWIATCEALVCRELAPQAHVAHTLLFSGHIAILVQPREDVGKTRPGDFLRYTRAGMYVVQEELRLSEGIVASFAIGPGLRRRRDLPTNLKKLWRLLERFGAAPEGVVIDDYWLQRILDRDATLPSVDTSGFALHLNRLDALLRRGGEEEFEREYTQLTTGADGRRRRLTIEQHTSLLILIFSVAQDLGLSQQLSVDPKDRHLWRPDNSEGLERRILWYLNLGRQICRLRLERVGWGAEQVVERIRAYVKEHIEDGGLSLLHVAEVSGYNPSYFSRLFLDQTGEHFSDYLTRLRFEHACSLLVRPEMTVAEVTRRCGFSSASYFAQFFRKRAGIPPSKYQKEESLRRACQDNSDPVVAEPTTRRSESDEDTE